MDARSGDHSRTGAWQIRRSRDHRGAAGVQCSARLFPRGESPGNARSDEVASGADRIGAARRCLEKASCSGTGAGRHRETFTWWRRGGGRKADRRKCFARSIHAHWRVHRHGSRSGFPNLCRRAGAARRSGRASHGNWNSHQVRSHG